MGLHKNPPLCLTQNLETIEIYVGERSLYYLGLNPFYAFLF